jgi:hypothetical protein
MVNLCWINIDHDDVQLIAENSNPTQVAKRYRYTNKSGFLLPYVLEQYPVHVEAKTKELGLSKIGPTVRK